MTTALLLTFSVGGGAPPPTGELLRLHRDGALSVLVTNAWPEGEPQDEVGVYETRLAEAEVGELEALLARGKLFDLEDEYTPFRPDSGSNVLRLYEAGREKRIRWGRHAEIPSVLADLRARLRDTLQLSRRHPAQTFALAIRVEPTPVAVQSAWQVEVTLANRGSRAVRALPHGASPGVGIAPRLLALPADQGLSGEFVALAYFHQAQPTTLRHDGDPGSQPAELTLGPGEERRFRVEVPFYLAQPGPHRLYGFADPRLQIILDGEPHTVDCAAVARPVGFEVAASARP